MRVLIAEGDPIVLDFMSYVTNYVRRHNVTTTSNTRGVINYLFYSDKEFDIIIIGDKLKEQLPRAVNKEMLPKIQGDKSYFPVTLAKVCQNICKKKGKKVPKIVIATTCYDYEFYMKNDGRKFDSYYISTLVKDYVEQSGFKFISKQDIDMFYQSLTKI